MAQFFKDQPNTEASHEPAPLDKELAEDFYQESAKILEDLESNLEELEEDIENNQLLETFGQSIDRIMGAAKSLELKDIGVICELGKVIGYKSSTVPDSELRKVVVAILFDTIDILQPLLENVRKGQHSELKALGMDKFITRLKWLSEKFKDVDKSSCNVKEEDSSKEGMSSDQLKDLEDIIGELE